MAKIIVLKAIEGLAKHLNKKFGGDPDFFTKCMADESVSSYDDTARKAVCAKAHKLAVGKWPAETKQRKLTFILDEDLINNASELKGGKGSGNFNHEGRPGKEGGSTSSSDVPSSDNKPAKKTKIGTTKKGLIGKLARYKKMRKHYADQPWRKLQVAQLDREIEKLERLLE
jgi:hypothetical protein